MYSHAEGGGTTASNYHAHAEGSNTNASGMHSHAQNLGTDVRGKAQTVLGTHNEVDVATTTTHPSGDTDFRQYAVIIGNGTGAGANRSNALTID